MGKKLHGMVGKRNAYRGGSSTKVKSISFGLGLLKKVTARAKKEKGGNVSAWVTEACAEKIERESKQNKRSET